MTDLIIWVTDFDNEKKKVPGKLILLEPLKRKDGDTKIMDKTDQNF